MSELQKKKNITSVIVVSCVIFVVLMLVALTVNLVKLSALKAKEKALLAKIDEINALIAEQDNYIDNRQTAEYVDKYVREYLYMQGQDEIAFIANG